MNEIEQFVRKGPGPLSEATPLQLPFVRFCKRGIGINAKLSQIIFAIEPRLELAIMVNGIGESSGHELANKKIVETAVNWIKNNKAMIDGYSDTKSEFSQIYLLTNEQIKECFKNADPLFLGQYN